MRFHVGEKVVVKSFPNRPAHWNGMGEMDKYMGRMVTIQWDNGSDTLPLSIKEDSCDNGGCGWHWEDGDFWPIPRIGDDVTPRSWQEMELQYGLQEGHRL